MHVSATPEQTVRLAALAASHAPSILNTQPWRFHGDGSGIEIHADPRRQLRHADPDGREMMISCGAAAFNAWLALRALGYSATITTRHGPGQDPPAVRISWHRLLAPATSELALHRQVAIRRSYRGGFLSRPVPRWLAGGLRGAAGLEGACLEVARDSQRAASVAAAVRVGETTLRLDRGRSREQARWATPPGSPRRDGVPPAAYPAAPARTSPEFGFRDFSRGRAWGSLTQRADGPVTDAGLVCVLTTPADRPEDWVRAGLALQRTLLTAAVGGASASPHSQPLEFPDLRGFVHRRLCDGYPQLILRVGFTTVRGASVRRPLAVTLA